MKVKKAGKIAGGQDGAIFNGYLFRFNGKGVCSVYRTDENINGPDDTRTDISVFTLDRADIIVPHSNSVAFGNEYYSEGDEFPLLYSNVYNNYASCTDKRKGLTCVYRILKNENEFSSRLVQLIEIGFTEDELWHSENGEDVRPYGNMAIDPVNSLYYAFTMRDGESSTRYFSFHLPKLSEGKYDGEFGVNRVVLEKEDVISFFDCEYHRYIQGTCCNGGFIYSLEGFTNNQQNPPAIRIIDLQSKSQKEVCLFSDYGLSVEPEMIDFADGICYYSDNYGNLFILEF